MNAEAQGLEARAPDASMAGVIKLAIMAVGGQGGGVLTSWIEDLARAEGYEAQATSVAGVAQRTGATIYYIEMAPVSDRGAPVFALAPAGGDVDIFIAAELMEAGRAILRGFVTPDRTTLIASSHRMLAVSEKMVPGDGIADPEEVRAAAEVAARRLILADMDRLAVDQGSVISASLFGALAGSGALPFPRAAFEEAIRRGGKGVEASLRAFAAGFDAASGGGAGGPDDTAPAPRPAAPPEMTGSAAQKGAFAALLARVEEWPAPVQEMAHAGLRKVVGFQDAAYGADYLDRVAAVLARDDADRDHLLTREAAKHVANAMAYDDVIRVAGIKTQGPRAARIRAEMGAGETQVMHVTEFMHPRAEEIVGLFPERLGRRVAGDPKWMARLGRWFGKGRRLRSDGLIGFTLLYVLGGMRGWRRRTLRHAQEVAHLERWLDTALGYLPDYDLAVEVIRCRRLIKGYSDTHERGLSKFDRVLEGAALVAGREDAAEWVARLREAALQDEEGQALDGALETVRSFA